jgi:hypothetical protein
MLDPQMQSVEDEWVLRANCSRLDQQAVQSFRIPLDFERKQAKRSDPVVDSQCILDQDKDMAECLQALYLDKGPLESLGRCKADEAAVVGNTKDTADLADNDSRGSDSTLHPTVWYELA